jgi:YegS/Rv2252/BmrU family lipid kinase
MFEIIVNPAGAGGATRREWSKVEPLFQKSGIPFHVTFSSLEHDIDAICCEVTGRGQDVDLVILGGDGSMNKALNGIQNFANVRLGFIPCGSGNDLAKALGISMNPVKCARKIIEQQIVRILDFGEVTYFNASHFCDGRSDTSVIFKRRFNISSGIGFDAEICENAERSKAKKFLNKIHLGKLIYLFVAMRVIFVFRKVNAFITLDDHEPIKKKLLSTAAMNTPYEGGGFKFCPAADPQDGILDMCIWGDVSKWDFFKMFPHAYNGSHLKYKEIDAKRADLIDVQLDEPCWVHTDGEVECMSSHVQMKLAADKLRYLD